MTPESDITNTTEAVDTPTASATEETPNRAWMTQATEYLPWDKRAKPAW